MGGRSREAKRMAPRSLARMLLLGGLLAPSVAHADNAETEARATKLFEEGRTLARDGNCTDAIPLFLESIQYTTGIGPLLNLGSCYELMGKTASAHRWFKRTEEVARQRHDDARATEASERAHALEPKLSVLTVRVVDPTEPNLELRLDDEPLERARWGTATPVDSGVHLLKASSPRRGNVTLRVAIGQRADHAELVVAPLPRPVPVVATAPATAADPGRSQRVIGYAVAGLGLGGVVLGSVFGALSASDHGSLVDACATYPRCPESQRGTLDDLNDRAHARGNIATISLVAGLALVAGGVTLVLLAPNRSAVPRGATGTERAFVEW